jgi:hypothetical protein
MHITEDGIKDQPASDTISKNESEGCASDAMNLGKQDRPKVLKPCVRKTKKDRKQIGSHDTNQEGPNTRGKNGPIKVDTSSSDTPKQRPKRLITRPSRFNT